MDVNPVPRIAGALLFRPAPHADERGFFCRTFDADVISAAGLDPAEHLASVRQKVVTLSQRRSGMIPKGRTMGV